MPPSYSTSTVESSPETNKLAESSLYGKVYNAEGIMFQWDMFEERLRRHEFEEWINQKGYLGETEDLFEAFKAGYNLRQKKFDEDDGW